MNKIHWTKTRISGKLPFATKKPNELAGNKEDSATELHKPWEKCSLGTGLHGLPLPPRGRRHEAAARVLPWDPNHESAPSELQKTSPSINNAEQISISYRAKIAIS